MAVLRGPGGPKLFVVLSISVHFFFPLSLQSQNRTLQPLIVDTVSVSVSNISIDAEFSLRGLTANFPFPVLTTISVVDSRGNPVLGLADTLNWVGPEDFADIGLPIGHIWNPILEFHTDEPGVPTDPDVFNQSPSPLFTEIRETTLLPTRTMLVMDASGSMRDEIEDAKEGARLYVQQMRSSDKAGVVVFGTQIKQFQPLTDSRNQLISTINRAAAGGATILYDAIMRGMLELRHESGRRGVIVYTDGRDNGSTIGPQAVIDTARVYNIPVFTIALGDSTNEVNLTRVAQETSGLFFKVATAKEMQEVYIKLAELIHNFYLMAHASPDPVRNNTFRTVSIDVNAANYFGQGQGVYFVEGPVVPEFRDLAVELTAVTDTSMVVDGREVSAVAPGDQYQYRIRLQNLGPSPADTVRLLQFLPDSVVMTTASRTPIFHDDNLLFWQFENLSAGVDTSVTVNVSLASVLPADLTALPSLAVATTEFDTLQENNTATDTVYVLSAVPPRPENFDLALSQTVNRTQPGVILRDSVETVFRGEPYGYVLIVENLGPGFATDFNLFNALPDSVSAANFTIEPDFRTLKTYFWQFDSLAPGGRITVSFDARVSDSLETLPFRLLNEAEVFAQRDTNSVNDSTATVVFAVKRTDEPPLSGADLSLRIAAQTDSFAVINGDTAWFAAAKETYSYFITVRNDSAIAAENVTMLGTPPDSVTIGNFNPPPTQLTGGSLRWDIGILPPLSSFVVQFDATVSPNMPVGRNLLISQASAQASNEDELLTANNTAVDTVFNLVRPGDAVSPLIEASPPVVDIGDSVRVRVQVRVPNATWDIWVTFADQQIDSTYADAFIRATELIPNEWFTVVPKFGNTRLRTNAEQERITFELRTFDVFGDFRTARASVTVQSNNGLVLDRNVFVASREDFLDIRFKLSSNRVARLDVFDITGSHVTTLTEAAFNAGWNTFSWNGRSAGGEKIGSGLYLVALRSGGFTAMKKVMVVR